MFDDTCSSWSQHSSCSERLSSASPWESPWTSCSDLTSPPSSPLCPSKSSAVNVTPSKNSESQQPRHSPRVPKAPKPKFDPSNVVKDSIGWQLSKVLELNGCQPRCAVYIHGLTEYDDVLLAHSIFSSKSVSGQREWLLEYFSTHCPIQNGEKDLKGMKYLVSGRSVCQQLWQATMCTSTSRFYEVRKDFMSGVGSKLKKKGKQIASKSMRTIEWMRSYFERVGDKRPDKDGIYLPYCLTESAIYSIMIADVPESSVVCFSQCNKLF